MNNWFDHILFHTRAQHEKPAIVMEDRVVTYGMMQVAIERCAQRIIAASINQDDGPVAVLVRNPIRHLTLCLALFRIGIVSVSLEHSQTGIRTIKFSAVIGDAEARAAVASSSRIIEIADDWFSVECPNSAPLPEGFLDTTQLCRLSLTSGTTGVPKSIQHRVEDVGRRVIGFTDFNWSLALCMPGLSSNWGFATSCAVLAAGRTLCFAESPFQAVRMIDLFSIDYVMASTEQLLALTRAARKSEAHLTNLRTIEFGGSVATRALLEAAVAHLCKDLYCRYGASEIGLVARSPAREVLRNPGLVGYIVPEVEIATFDDHGSQCPANQVGVVKGRFETKYAPSSSSRGRSDNPWIDLGDMGWIDSSGRLFIIGRTADIAVANLSDASTLQISPIHEIEHIFRLEWDATDAAAVLMNDDSDSAQPEIWVGIVDCKDARVEKLSAILRQKGIGSMVRLVPLSSIPRGANGKVQRAQLKSLMLTAADQTRGS